MSTYGATAIDFIGKRRNPWAVVALTVVTFGCYAIHWWYAVNRELRDAGRAHRLPELGDRPGVSALAFALGFLLVIPGVVTVVATSQRLQAAQRIRGQRPLNGWLAAALWVTTVVGGLWLMQRELNRIWASSIASPGRALVIDAAPAVAAPAFIAPTAARSAPVPSASPVAAPVPVAPEPAGAPAHHAGIGARLVDFGSPDGE